MMWKHDILHVKGNDLTRKSWELNVEVDSEFITKKYLISFLVTSESSRMVALRCGKR